MFGYSLVDFPFVSSQNFELGIFTEFFYLNYVTRNDEDCKCFSFYITRVLQNTTLVFFICICLKWTEKPLNVMNMQVPFYITIFTVYFVVISQILIWNFRCIMFKQSDLYWSLNLVHWQRRRLYQKRILFYVFKSQDNKLIDSQNYLMTAFLTKIFLSHFVSTSSKQYFTFVF